MLQQITTLECCFPNINDGGFHIVEDTHTSYWTQWGGSDRTFGSTFTNYAKAVTDSLNKQHFDIHKMHSNQFPEFDDLYAVSFYNSMVVFEKKKVPEFKIVESAVPIVEYKVG